MILPSYRAGCVLSFFLILSLSAASQKNFLDGYIVKKDGDSLRGQIDYKDWGASPSQIVFQGGGGEGAGGVMRVLGPVDLLAFGVNGERYETHTVRVFPYSLSPDGLTSEDQIDKPYDSTVFLQVLTTGRLTLWELRTTLQTSYFFVNGQAGKPEQLRLITRISQQENGTTAATQEEMYKNQLSYLLRDCPAAVRRIGRTTYSEYALRQLVFTYDYCGKDTVEKAAVSGKTGLRLFPMIGYATTSQRFTGGEDVVEAQHWPASGSLEAGLGLLLPLPRNRQQFSFVLDVVWQHFHSAITFNDPAFFVVYGEDVAYNLMTGDILFRYRYPAKKVKPFLETGLGFGMAFGIKATRTDFYTNSNLTYTYPNPGGVNERFPGWVGGGGVNVGRWGLEGRVTISQAVPGDPGAKSRDLTVGVMTSFQL